MQHKTLSDSWDAFKEAFTAYRLHLSPGGMSLKAFRGAGVLLKADLLIPDVRVRQWVLSLPWSLRYQLAFDAALPAYLAKPSFFAVASTSSNSRWAS